MKSTREHAKLDYCFFVFFNPYYMCIKKLRSMGPLDLWYYSVKSLIAKLVQFHGVGVRLLSRGHWRRRGRALGPAAWVRIPPGEGRPGLADELE